MNLYNLASLVFRYPGTIGFRTRYRLFHKRDITLVGTPLHKNMGDHLISEAELRFLRDTFPGKRIFEIPTEVFLRFSDCIEKNVAPGTRIFITGGGWMGSLWPKDEMILQNMISVFSDCSVTILPQTVFYDPCDEEGKYLLENANNTFMNCADLKICVRDEASYGFAVNNFTIDKDKIILSPDMALYYQDTKQKKEKSFLGLFLRGDREKVSDDEFINKIRSMIPLEPFESDTMHKRLVPIWRRRRNIEALIDQMRSCEIIVTDRLHAMIYSVIAGTKCIALDNKTGKVSGVYQKWLSWDENILLVKDTSDIPGFINKPYKESEYIKRLKPEFEKLRHFVLER